MSGSYNYLTALFGGSSSVTDPILAALYGGGGGGSGVSPAQALQTAETNQTQQVAATASQPQVQQAIKAFTLAVNNATSVTQLLSNPAVMNVLLTANNMQDQIGYTALATQALTSNLSDPNSLVNKLTDSRWQTLAKSYNFATNGLSAIQNPTAIASIANAYAQATWQSNQDSVTPGLSNALAFKSQAAGITSVAQILGNMTVRTVVTTALGIPPQIAFQDMGAQTQAIASRLDVTKLQDPKFVDSLAVQYLVANSANAASAAGSSPDITALAIQAGGIMA